MQLSSGAQDSDPGSLAVGLETLSHGAVQPFQVAAGGGPKISLDSPPSHHGVPLRHFIGP